MGQEIQRPYRLGIDVGSNSLGWFVVWLGSEGEPAGLGPGGVRIFPDGRDPKSKESNAADRRVARSMRRRRDRYRFNPMSSIRSSRSLFVRLRAIHLKCCPFA